MNKFRKILVVAAVIALSTPAVAAPRSVAPSRKATASRVSPAEPTLLQRILRKIRPLDNPTPLPADDPGAPTIRTTGPIG